MISRHQKKQIRHRDGLEKRNQQNDGDRPFETATLRVPLKKPKTHIKWRQPFLPLMHTLCHFPDLELHIQMQTLLKIRKPYISVQCYDFTQH